MRALASRIPSDNIRSRSERIVSRRVRFFDMFFYDELIHNLCMCLYW